jgi:hypothetical protein
MSIHYKFKSGKEFSSVPCDTPHLALSELRRLVAEQRGLDANAPDYDLAMTDAQTGEAYDDDGNFLVPRNSSVIVRRRPKDPADAARLAPLGEGGWV